MLGGNIMSLVRCAACGSNNIEMDKRKEGYSVKRGFLGTAILGTAGAVMGVNGKEQKYYHCAMCGQTINHPLDYKIADQIDTAIKNKNVKILDKLRERYPNIEKIEVNVDNNSINEEELKEQIKNQIIEYLEGTRVLITWDDIIQHIKKINDWKEIKDRLIYQKCLGKLLPAFKELKENGSIIEERIDNGEGYEQYYRLPKDQEEALSSRKEAIRRKEARKVWEELAQLVKDILIATDNMIDKYEEFYKKYQKEDDRFTRYKICDELAQELSDKWSLVENYDKCKVRYDTYKEKSWKENFDREIAERILKKLKKDFQLNS